MVLNRWDGSPVCLHDGIDIHVQMHANLINTVKSEIHARQSRFGKSLLVRDSKDFQIYTAVVTALRKNIKNMI